MVIKKIGVLFSGSGTNLEKILQSVHDKEFSTCTIKVVCLISNKTDSGGIQKAKKYGLDTIVVEHANFETRELFDEELVRILKSYNLDLVVLAGFMRILTPIFTKNIKAINLHPSLLPLFKGAHAIEDSYNSSMKVGGISVHYVSEELDGGEIISQKCFYKTKKMTIEKFENKIHNLEYELLPKTIVDILDKN